MQPICGFRNLQGKAAVVRFGSSGKAGQLERCFLEAGMASLEVQGRAEVIELVL